MSHVCRPGLREMYNETPAMRLFESRNALTRGNFHLSSHPCGLLISKGLVVNTFFFQRALFTAEGIAILSAGQRRALGALRTAVTAAPEQAFGSDLSGGFPTPIE